MLRLVTSMRRWQKRLVMLALDLALVPLALLAALALQFNTLAPIAQAGEFWLLVAAQMGLAVVVSNQLAIPSIQLKAYEMQGVGKTAVFALALGTSNALTARLAGLGLPAGLHVVFGLIFFVLSASLRFVMLRMLLAIYAREHPRRKVVIYGAGSTGLQLARALKTDQRVEPVAFVDDSPALQGLTVAGLAVDKPVRLPDLVAQHGVRRVILAMPSLSQPKQTQLARRLETMGLEVQALPSFAQLIGEKALVEKLAPIPPGSLLGRARLDERIAGGARAYAGRSVLISGAGGTIGSELCRQVLACRPARLVLYEHAELALYTVDMELKALAEATGTEIVAVLGSVADAALAERAMAENGVDVVLHAAAYKHVPLVEANPVAGMANNVLGTATLAQAARTAGVGRFILVSSDKAVRPTGVMGASKRLSEMVVQDLATRSETTVFAMVRFGNVLGSSGSVVPLFQEQISRGGPVTVTHEKVTRYFMTVEEAARLTLCSGSFARGGELFVLDMGAPVAIRGLARDVIEAQGYTVRDADTPDGDIEIRVTGLRPGEKLHEELILNAGAVTTPHEKIFAAREDCLSEIEVAAALQALRAAVAGDDAEAVHALIARWIDGHARPAAEQQRT